jgi:hypothetical protein
MASCYVYVRADEPSGCLLVIGRPFCACKAGSD